jgi:hypothetical protein
MMIQNTDIKNFLESHQPAKVFRFKKQIEGYMEELHTFTKDDFKIDTEMNYNSSFLVDREFGYAFAVAIVYKGKEIIELNFGKQYRSKHNALVDLREAKRIVSILLQDQATLDIVLKTVAEQEKAIILN